MRKLFHLENVAAINLGKSKNKISTGIGFFDHMLDQFNSHAQIGVSVEVSRDNVNVDVPGEIISRGVNGSNEDVHLSKNRYAEPVEMQNLLMEQVGEALGCEIKIILLSLKNKDGGKMIRRNSRFCCPLDEALVECNLTACSDVMGKGKGNLEVYTLAPYRSFPKTGRIRIGRMLTSLLETFFRALAQSSGLNIKLLKIRGMNGHHIIESAFKALSRALRNLIDDTNTDTLNIDDDATESTWCSNSLSYKEGIAMDRSGKSQRQTKGTAISILLTLDGGGDSKVIIDSGVCTINDFYTALAREAQISLNVMCNGDTWVDDHHTSEDVSIAIGKVLDNALGTKAGLNRMWCATAKVGDTEIEVVMDLSNRPCIRHNLNLGEENDEEYVGDMSVEMLDHILDSLVMNGQMTVHILEIKSDGNLMDCAIATAKAFGRALRFCTAVDPRRAGQTASSKGTLSV